MNKPISLVILISGNGSNLQAIIDAINNKQLNATITAVISNNPNAYGLQRANNAMLTTKILNQQDYASKDEFDIALLKLLKLYQPDLIILAGFMRILSDVIVTTFKGKMLNIHPALLPKYPGLGTYKRVLESGDKEHGTTVHYVTEELDGGPIIAQSKTMILSSDTPESLKNRVQKLEHQLYPYIIQLISEKKLNYTPQGVVFEGKLLHNQGLSIQF